MDYDIKMANEFRNIGEASEQLKELILYFLKEEGFKTKEEWWNQYLWPAIADLIGQKRVIVEAV